MVKKVVGKKPAKKTTKKTNQAKPVGFVIFVKRYKFIIIVLVSTLLILGVVGNLYISNKVAISNEKKQFESAETALNQLQSEIITKLGEPVSANSTNVCGYASTVDGRGDRGCGVGFEIFYESQSVDTESTFNELLSVIKSDEYRELTYQKYDQASKSGDSSFIIVDVDKNCGLSLRNTEENETTYPGTKIRSSCSGDAKAEHYPVKE